MTISREWFAPKPQLIIWSATPGTLRVSGSPKTRGASASSLMGKGSKPRNVFSRAFRDGFDRIFGKRGPQCPHGKYIGDDCAECQHLAKPCYVGDNWRSRKTSV